ncbi:nitrile hydratase subunit beta [Neorhizobium sp. Rsf11]|uniref:Nitrile hydratase subunit beta n=2 Tax=Neorhizobium TaxID=1525371 RepID=A0ABV0MBY9_9HYPH|nr:nitrile hydratase subunit beta [Neorhizobium petrolearium]MCC2613723.1 nitrile hydratase subunit beta [Neorhizobium petrolearium]WGI72035.1 nitrile hydratase subunit beta [Neorhizobium petrolearium]
MNGPHDLGGLMGFGAIPFEPNEPVFHWEWEKRALGVSLCIAGLGVWNIDENRHSYERIAPATYLRASYYEIWIRGLDKLLVEHGLVVHDEIFLSKPIGDVQAAADDILRESDVAEMLLHGPAEQPSLTPPAYRIGDLVRTRNINPTGHTRLPRYARSRRGIIDQVQGSYVFPDDNAHGRGANPQWVYTVVFSGRELWGEDADARLSVSIDACESYLERDIVTEAGDPHYATDRDSLP